MGTHRDDAPAVGAGRGQRLLDKDRRQPAPAEFGIDLGVVEDPLIATVGEGGETDGFALTAMVYLPSSVRTSVWAPVISVVMYPPSVPDAIEAAAG